MKNLEKSWFAKFSEQVVFRYVWSQILCSVRSTTTWWREMLWNGFLTVLDRMPRRCGCPQEAARSEPWGETSREKDEPRQATAEPLRQWDTLEALWLLQGGGSGGCPHWVTFLAILSSRPDLSEWKIVMTITATTEGAPNLYPTLFHAKSWEKHFINLSFKPYPFMSIIILQLRKQRLRKIKQVVWL